MSRLIDQKESATQARVTRLFTESLGYTYLGRWSDRPDNRNIEPALLRAFLLAQGVDAGRLSAVTSTAVSPTGTSTTCPQRPTTRRRSSPRTSS